MRKYNKCKRLLHIYGLYYCSTNRLCWKLLLLNHIGEVIALREWVCVHYVLSILGAISGAIPIYVLPLLNCFSALLKVFSIICVVRHIIWQQFQFFYPRTRTAVIHNSDRSKIYLGVYRTPIKPRQIFRNKQFWEMILSEENSL